MTLIIALFVAPLAILTFCFAVEVVVGLRPLPRVTQAPARFDAVIIVPAHDEEVILAATLERLKEAAQAKARVLLVADNCTDQTAQIGQALGVEVIERFDRERRGKGYALDFARRYLQDQPPAIVLVVDADCSIDAPSIELLIDSCASLQRPCQATNLQRASPTASPAVQLSTFAFFIKNVVRERAVTRLAGRAHLLGTGMAFPWHIFAGAELATNNIVEDLKLGRELAEIGYPPIFIEEAAVWSSAETDSNTIAQRQRWEGGYLQTAMHAGPRMLAKALINADIRHVWAAIDLMIPPFALLILLDVIALLVVAVFGWLGSAHLWPLFTLTGALALALFALGLAWANGGSKFVSLKSLGRAPLYVVWKLPMYIGLARRGAPKEWLRTGR